MQAGGWLAEGGREGGLDRISGRRKVQIWRGYQPAV